MKKLSAAAVTLALTAVISLGIAPGAQAQWGEPTPAPYCSASVGCYTGANGQPIFAKGPALTAREESLRQQCYWRLAGSGVGLAGGIAGKNVLSVLAAVINGGSAISGPCRDLWNSTARFRK